MVKETIDYLITKNSITDLIWTRIFYWVPNSDQTLTYLTINQVTEINPLDLQTITRLEFRFIWWDVNINYSILENIEKIVRTELLKFTWENIYKIIVSNKVNWYDDKARKIIIRDILIYNTN